MKRIESGKRFVLGIGSSGYNRGRERPTNIRLCLSMGQQSNVSELSWFFDNSELCHNFKYMDLNRITVTNTVSHCQILFT